MKDNVLHHICIMTYLYQHCIHSFIFSFYCLFYFLANKKNEKIKNEDVIFPIQNEIKILKNRRHAFIFGQKDLRFFV